MKIKFSDSAGVALAFASRLLSGSLNAHPNSDGFCSEITYHDDHFSTAIIQELAKDLEGYQITEMVVSEKEDNPSGKTPDSMIRHVTIYGTDWLDEHPIMATFDLEMDTVVVQGLQGWTTWYVTNVHVIIGRNPIPLVCKTIKRDGENRIIWGQVTSDTQEV